MLGTYIAWFMRILQRYAQCRYCTPSYLSTIRAEVAFCTVFDTLPGKQGALDRIKSIRSSVLVPPQKFEYVVTYVPSAAALRGIPMATHVKKGAFRPSFRTLSPKGRLIC